MGDTMKYPYIGKGKISDAIMLFVSEVKAVTLDRSNSFYNGEQSELVEGLFTNITHEYLSNTWGVVESKEHAEFIIELAELHGFEVDGYSERADTYFYFGDDYLGFVYSAELASSRNEKQITIPLPPKAKEWPQVGDEVVTPTGKGKLVVANPDKQGVVIVLVDDEDYGNIYKRVSLISLQKPKTPDEEFLKSNISESPKEGFEKAIDKVKSLQQDFSSEQATLDCKELDINVVFTGEGVYILDCINSAEYQLESVDEYNKVVSAIRLLQSKENSR